MTIKTKGRMFNAEWAFSGMRSGRSRLTMALETDAPMSDIAAAFEGAAIIERTNEKKPGVIETYEGFTKLMSISRENADGVTIVTLEME